MIQLRQTVTYSLSIQAIIKGKMEDPAYQFSGRWPCRRSYSWSGKSGYPFTGRYPDRLSWHSTETGFERNDILSGCSKYHEYIRYCKNSIASALAEQIHKNFNYVIKSSSENGYNATVTTEITTFDSDSILADYQEKLDKYLASADAVIDGSQKRYEKSFEILLNSINDNTVTTVNDVDFVLINDGVSWNFRMREILWEMLFSVLWQILLSRLLILRMKIFLPIQISRQMIILLLKAVPIND